MANPNVYVPPQLLGSTDWTGGRAPAGGSHTGTATLTFKNGQRVTVAHSVAECKEKIRAGREPTNPGNWVAFDQPGQPVPIILCVANLAPNGVA